MAKRTRKSLPPPVDAGMQLRARGWVQWLRPVLDDLLKGLARDALLVETSGDKVAEARVDVIAPLLSKAWSVMWPEDLEAPPSSIQLKDVKAKSRRKARTSCSKSVSASY